MYAIARGFMSLAKNYTTNITKYASTKKTFKSAMITKRYKSNLVPSNGYSRCLKRYQIRYYSSAPTTPVSPFKRSESQDPSQYQDPALHVRRVDAEGIPRVTPTILYRDLKEGIASILIDIRPKEEFDIFHIIGSVNLPGDTFTPDQIDSEFPLDRAVYILCNWDGQKMDKAIKVASALKKAGAYVSIVEARLDAFPDAGFFYYMDVPKEAARKAAEPPYEGD